MEFTDGWPTRQIDIVDGRCYSSLDEPVRDQYGVTGISVLASACVPGDGAWGRPLKDALLGEDRARP
jgi:hypothetical protein